MAVIISGVVDPARNGDVERDIVQQGSRGKKALFKGEGIEKGFQGRPNLSFRLNAIHEPAERGLSAIAHVTQDSVRPILHDENRPVPDILLPQGEKMVGHAIEGKLLDLTV
jgi:hypothetical protein